MDPYQFDKLIDSIENLRIEIAQLGEAFEAFVGTLESRQNEAPVVPVLTEKHVTQEKAKIKIKSKPDEDDM